MDTLLLNEKLKGIGANPNCYSIGKIEDNCHILLNGNDGWNVFFY